ncbi:hypothetical protein V6N12_048819 [Hibiscus sabdariffa]|uniref:Subtilisin inhibitor 1 n=1 Tax=Hibiscus sabdariffa TaxID=183260 RepID=A0ABR2EID1_9ROSI
MQIPCMHADCSLCAAKVRVWNFWGFAWIKHCSKMEWPELVGLAPDEAEKKIKEDMPTVQIQVVQPNNFVTMDFNRRRVRLYLDPSGKVGRPPRIG